MDVDAPMEVWRLWREGFLVTLILRVRPFFSGIGDLGDLSSKVAVDEMEDAEEWDEALLA
jgi:hypothetical protein